MSGSLNITPAQARAIVLEAAVKIGWVSQHDRDNSTAGTLEALKNVREGLGDALEMYVTVKHDFEVLHSLNLVD